MKKNDDTMLNQLYRLYKKLNERCNSFFNEILDEKPRNKDSLLNKIRAKFAKYRAKDKK